MADKTIAYSNSGGFWKTRYTFVSSCYAFVDRCLISFNKAFTSAPVWKHDDNNVARTRFYKGTPDGSGIAVTFNENPSQNKLYKAFSLESTNNVAGLNIFTVNNSNIAQRKEIEVGVLEDRGGIMYGHIGRETVVSGANVKLVGRITGYSGEPSTFNSDGSFRMNYTMQFAEGGKSNLSKGAYIGDNGVVQTEGATVGSKFFIYNAAAGDGQAQYFTTLSTVGITLPTTYAAFPSDLTLFNLSLGGGNTSENNISLTVGLEPSENESYYQELVDGVYDTGNLYLYSISPEAMNAEDPKGQTADAVILLGSEPYELYALNVEYSPTDLDHSK